MCSKRINTGFFCSEPRTVQCVERCHTRMADPLYDRESIMADPGDRPHIQCRLAHPYYRFERVGDGPRKNVPEHGYTRKVQNRGEGPR